MMENNTIAILMATYNGESFLQAQIDSIFAQTFPSWHLYVHDDGSTDATVALLRACASDHPSQVTLLDYPAQGGACHNFMSMLQRVEAPYYMFADQDDVWHADKIEKSMQAMRLVEQQHPQAPVVVHSDLRIVDHRLNTLHPSFFQFANIHPERIARYEEYMQNVVTGCTMLFNRRAKTAAQARPYASATMHDSWITLRAVADGGIRHTLYEPLTDYRQHAENVLGAQDGHRFTLAYRLTHALEMLRLNLCHYRMLRDAGDMTLATFIRNKYQSHKQNTIL